ncbi:methyl-accepting chemotaxis protein [Acetobacter oeni]|uniref:Methyl-accepting chemotaxis protein n=1 Tax=Acetobacter oeni TaxID=304077 RepID=A0A511XHN5_9PROT|nr:methyl-accepting chemotaxis protein [Acetobacter oeni]MBB3881305.1 methyl-accepting chemotaxis protein [Acetobacter oeni]GEN62460.1 methyl-accepting chemotaxis protein [Acetobacter oeni]
MTNREPFDIEGRVKFLNIGPRQLDVLQSTSGDIAATLPRALDEFYARIEKTPDLSSFFSCKAQITHARTEQMKHWHSIVTDRFRADYLRRVEKIGATHARIGLPTRWYIAGNSLLIEAIIGDLIRKSWPENRTSSLFGSRTPDDVRPRDDLVTRVGLLIKATMLDMELAVTSALDTAEDQRQAEAIEQEKALDMLAGALEQVAEGNLSVQVDAKLRDKSPRLAMAFETLISGLTGIICSVRENAERVEQDARMINRESQGVASVMDVQVNDLENLSRTIENIADATKLIAGQTADVNNSVAECEVGATHGEKTVSDVTDAIEKISRSSNEISQIVGLINELSLQTNLLALNAGVEAARAGDAGKGFAVVAQEVRNLAVRSAEATKQIRSLIDRSAREVEEGVELANSAGVAIASIRKSIGAVGTLAQQIDEATNIQSSRADEISKHVTRLEQETRRNAGAVHQTARKGQAMDASSLELTRLVSNFRIDQYTARTPWQTASSGNWPDAGQERALPEKVVAATY